ncbi:DNA repair protein RecN [Alkalibacter rhizosphaerae]|uniref:DNA repair protein RecN n=1 Tax=Alkalibacter rhizosphaerae TaxID=2815577 RepID=A0A974XFU6_9FIRM|nr:DNA repair protein RecN [Alkalibacter rhizosphaerae]QSX08931.1 DNA repair protein RecN [Alkalibacter rhizosphaerae]
MLAELNIKNYALIDNLCMEFEPGLNVLTGETGAGKSIIINALMMVLGARGSREMIQTGKDRLVVQAEFFHKIVPDNLKKVMDAMGIEVEGSLILYRELHENGRNVCRVNGMMVTVSDLKKVGDQLVDIHSQRDHNLILNREEHLGILDSYGAEAIQEKKQQTETAHDNWYKLRQEKRAMLEAIQRGERELEMYRFQHKEIDALSFEPDEDERLEERIKILSHAEVLFRNAIQVYESLYGRENAALGLLFQAKKDLEEMERIDGLLKDAGRRLEEMIIELEDISFFIRNYKEGIAFDDEELNQAQSKLNKLNGLKRKYGFDLTQVLAYKEELKEKIQRIEGKDEFLDQLEKALDQAKNDYLEAAGQLHEERKKVGRDFQGKINEQLHQLAMPESDVDISIEWSEGESSFSPTGSDLVEFFIRTNKGEAHKPLIKIASGGEVSRIMLAIKSIIGLTMGTKCLVFDEVDTGISGKAAGSVGAKLEGLSRHAQVIAITHLPQIASMAPTHFEVTKDSTGEKTKTIFRKLGPDDRIRALAVMMDGKDTPKSRELSMELLKRNDLL